jgi:predicted peptidase
MKLFVAAFFPLLLLIAQTALSEVVPVSFRGNHFYYIRNEGNKKLLIFLHGGVNNPSFNTDQVIPKLNYLLEGNIDLVPLANENGFDLLIPIKNDSLNWVDNYEYCFQQLKTYSDSTRFYNQIFLSGFSDGGTGSYRIFYSHWDAFDGLIVFNGYPQLNNFYKKVDCSSIKNKKILFLSTKKDNVIPYEFLMTEYAKQKKFNPDTYFFLADGEHNFGDYKRADLKQVFDMIKTVPDNTKTEVIHGYIRKDSLIHFYEFREKINRKYGYEPEFLKENQKQQKRFSNSR